MAWADQEEWLLDLARDGDVPKALIDRPALKKSLQFYWNAFWSLSGDRQLGMGGAGAIPFVALDAYARRFRVAGEAFERFASLVGAMDREYLKWAAEKSKEGADG